MPSTLKHKLLSHKSSKSQRKSSTGHQHHHSTVDIRKLGTDKTNYCETGSKCDPTVYNTYEINGYQIPDCPPKYRIIVEDGKYEIHVLETNISKTYKILKSGEYKSVWLGSDPGNSHGKTWRGNTILFCIGENNYLFVGCYIYLFTTYTPITRFRSPVGCCGASFPYVVDSEHTYLLNKLKCYKNKDLGYTPGSTNKYSPYDLTCPHNNKDAGKLSSITMAVQFV